MLRSDELAEVEHIEGAGLQEIYDSFRHTKIPNVPYKLNEQNLPKKNADEIDLLVAEKRRSERALTRIQNLYLYGETAISEKDYLSERKRMSEELEKIDIRIEELEKDRTTHFSISDSEFIEKASYFFMMQKLTDKRDINYEKFMRNIDGKIIKDFLHSIVQNFCIKNGRIESIRFKNGMEYIFLYKDENE